MTRNTKEYWEQRDKEMLEDIAVDKKYVNSYRGRIHGLSIKLSACPDWDKDAQAIILGEMAKLEAEETATEETAFVAEWTPEVTAVRRAEWNAWVKQAQPTPVQITRKQNEQGWRLEELKKAVQHYND
ncbi:hypothetical protein LCGC14_0386930 [marine sediment metagenome]|uniref:Uncharacterized protein n=1 Tax=marine sediment metagenome TaxID=412755 RepID=A0A0F9T0Q6_9ZZZZ